MPKASGPFDVKVTPHEAAPDATVARMLLYKEFHGELEAIAHGEMIASSEPLTGAAAYVALDRVTGTLHDRSGSFLIAHRGTMNSAGQQLSIIIVPGSGTGQLEGITGTIGIRIEEKKHYYDIEYEV